ncbi:uncharacterized protein LOC121864128 isoform X2 [Homarus americanus]|uniref:uncharacterized protein LOC121864128 isoform X2 n=1 Tax=Homarus americanus TaxID=6706 RepID=UPI001C461C85|nr:uncharacterized protein LOC121864128 isoform X2 [Homarus americanus]
MSEEINADTLQEILISAKEDLQKVLDEARQKFEELGSHFVDQGIGVLCQGLGVYGHLYKRSGLQDREALDIAISKSHNVVKEAALDLLEIEDDWNEFLSTVEAKEAGKLEVSPPQVGDKIPTDLVLNCVISNKFSNTNDGSTASHETSATMDAVPSGKTSRTISLADILVSTPKNVTLLILNRHFA